MRILHVIHDYHPAVGGSELLFQTVGEALVARGHEVRVFTSNALRTPDFVSSAPAPLAPGVETINGIQVRRFRYIRLPAPLRTTFNALAAGWWHKRWPGYGHMKSFWVGPHLPGLVAAVKRFRPDVIAATASPFMPIYRAARAGKLARIPTLVMPCLHPEDTWLVDNPALWSLLRRVDGILTLTPYEGLLLTSLGVDRARVHLIGGGVARLQPPSAVAVRELKERSRIPLDVPLVLFLGRKDEKKGIGQVVDAMARIWRTGSPARLALAGSSTEYSRGPLDAQIKALPPSWQDKIVLRDDIDEGEKWNWYDACSVMAHPSRVESFGLVYLEAWLAGKPVIGGRSGPTASVIAHGRDGLLVRHGDADELADAIGQLIGDEEQARRFGEAGRSKVLAHFTWERIIDKVEQTYRAVIDVYA
jgi:glycogen(starch) synthase